jgi:hypothetical protein
MSARLSDKNAQGAFDFAQFLARLRERRRPAEVRAGSVVRSDCIAHEDGPDLRRQATAQAVLGGQGRSEHVATVRLLTLSLRPIPISGQSGLAQ